MAKFNGRVSLVDFKKVAGRVEVYGTADYEWRQALERARTWRRAAAVLPSRHPMLAIASGEEV